MHNVIGYKIQTNTKSAAYSAVPHENIHDLRNKEK